MVYGDIKTINIYCGTKVYTFVADGYMHGNIIKPYDANDKRLLEDIYNEFDKNTRNTAFWAETIQSAERRSGGDSGVSRRGRPSFDDILLEDQSNSYTAGNNERVRQTFETEEEIDELLKKLRAMMMVRALHLYSSKLSSL